MPQSQASSSTDPQPCLSTDERVVSWKMTQCLNPDCLHSNPDNTDLCQRCGAKLLLGDRYRAIRSIGSGGFACTFAAVDEHRLQTPCVIKQFLPRQQNHEILQTSINLFRQEAHILKALGSHRQIPSLLAFFEQENRFYLVQDFIEGQSLFESLTQQGAVSEEQVRDIFGQLLPILQFVHQKQVIHRDIKLSNIIRQPNQKLVLIDFGGSIQTNTSFRSITGTPGYAPPEQLRGQVVPASDLYSLGVASLRLLTAELPQDDGSDPLFDQQRQQWQIPDFVSPELRQILVKLLQPQVKERYASATEVLEALAVIDAPSEPIEALYSPVAVPVKPQILLHSEVGLDYQRLQDLLMDQNYREADQETWHLMLQATERQAEGCLDLRSLRQFPQVDLTTIDQLWQGLSQGRFGFTVQKQIYQSLGGKAIFNYPVWAAFGQQMGWLSAGQWLHYGDLNFSPQAPRGSFPAYCADPLNRNGFARGVCGWWRLGFNTLLERLEDPVLDSDFWA
ncbi:MAG: GUN4 domain-containing protein [Thermosynechococcaceae cyanobacterium]